MGYLGLGFRGLRLEIMLCLESYVLSELQEPDFMFLAKEPGKFSGGAQIFFKRSFKQILCDQNEEIISHQVKKIII